MILASKIAVGLASGFDADRKAHTIRTARKEVTQAVAEARAAGYSDEARLALEKRADPPSDPVGGEVWPGVIEAGLKVLE